MPIPKRWFPVSRDINDDPEFEELCNKFGIAGVRIFLEIFAILDKTENVWRISGEIQKTVGRKCGTNQKIVGKVLKYFQEKDWVTLQALPNNCFAYSARNYWKYHRNRDPKKEFHELCPTDDVAPSLSITNHPVTDLPVTKKIETPPLPPSPFKRKEGGIGRRKNGQEPQKLHLTRPEDFNQFWTHYPRKEGKYDAMKAWGSLEKEMTDELLKVIFEALGRHKMTQGWQSDGGQFIPYPASWIRGRRWEDEGCEINQSKGNNFKKGKIKKNIDEEMRTGFNPQVRNYSMEGW